MYAAEVGDVTDSDNDDEGTLSSFSLPYFCF